VEERKEKRGENKIESKSVPKQLKMLKLEISERN